MMKDSVEERFTINTAVLGVVLYLVVHMRVVEHGF